MVLKLFFQKELFHDRLLQRLRGSSVDGRRIGMDKGRCQATPWS